MNKKTEYIYFNAIVKTITKNSIAKKPIVKGSYIIVTVLIIISKTTNKNELNIISSFFTFIFLLL